MNLAKTSKAPPLRPRKRPPAYETATTPKALYQGPVSDAAVRTGGKVLILSCHISKSDSTPFKMLGDFKTPQDLPHPHCIYKSRSLTEPSSSATTQPMQSRIKAYNLAKAAAAILGLLASASVWPSRAQNLLVNGSFDAIKVTKAAGFSDFTAITLSPWRTKEAVFELWTNGFWGNGYRPPIPYPTQSADGGQNLEILANAGTNTVWQTVPTVPNQRYVFSFYHSPRPNQHSKLTVSIDSKALISFDENGLLLTRFRWERFTTNFIASTNFTTLAFTDIAIPGGKGTVTGAGTHIDGVTLEHIPFLRLQRTGPYSLNLSWFGVSNETYQLQYSTNLPSTPWLNVAAPLLGSDNTNDFTPPSTTAPARFYRITVGP